MEYENTWLYPGVLWAKTEDSVLDLCCGTGDLTFLMSEKVGSYGKVTGFDFSKEQLSIASSRHYLFSKVWYNNIEERIGETGLICRVISYARHYEIGGGLMGNLVATR
ncbi:2-phytyl-1,4-beta-naphthoquinone methyltransferase, chloroplastic-like isoform X2 [Durio zibethinus]|uniref:2-phytyl-1,4-beta-naphthoquinone methyltransferase, chloroplastic-like isoform X2 n=1 Tax=Durio zibethinus TaxID=66656 RepID=A0A6P5XYY3_DURZI|nr:2-phytyl-1,4-beta-naphthoquinone methyltransferase, chloroplastic-like isoform X2 [Durio zibethinus]